MRGAGRALNEEADHKVVLLGEQSASKTGGVGSNPTDLAWVIGDIGPGTGR